MAEIRLFGTPDFRHIKAVREAGFHSGNFYMAVMDGTALWDPAVLDVITGDFPPRLLPETNLYLALVECIANAALHGNAEALGLFARKRSGVLLISFFQTPPMAGIVVEVLRLARSGALPDYTCDLPGGLGFPILLRLAEKITISHDRTRLQLWFRIAPEKNAVGFLTWLLGKRRNHAAAARSV